jgi:hypothetical protein
MPVGEHVNGHRNVLTRSRRGRGGLIRGIAHTCAGECDHEVVIRRAVRQALVGVGSCGDRIRIVQIVPCVGATARCRSHHAVTTCACVGVPAQRYFSVPRGCSQPGYWRCLVLSASPSAPDKKEAKQKGNHSYAAPAENNLMIPFHALTTIGASRAARLIFLPHNLADAGKGSQLRQEVRTRNDMNLV